MARDEYDCFKLKFVDIGQMNDCCTCSVFVLHHCFEL